MTFRTDVPHGPVPPGPRQLLGRLLVAPSRGRVALARHLTPEQKERLRKLVRARR